MVELLPDRERLEPRTDFVAVNVRRRTFYTAEGSMEHTSDKLSAVLFLLLLLTVPFLYMIVSGTGF
jgi:hypothetical protein